MPTKQIAWDDSSGDHFLLTYQGQGNGSITVVSDVNNGAARSKTVVIETTAGSPVITKNLTVNQPACPVPVGTVLNYAYTGSYQEVLLPAGQYNLQCWGAQGGSNAAASSYGITAKAGGKGGYSEGVLTLTSKTTLRIYVGGAGSSSAGGFNGGGSTSGSASYNSGNEQGVSRMGGGGGATDIRLSDGALLSRMIVAGGGSGGAMCYKAVTTTTTTYTPLTVTYKSHNYAGGYYISDYSLSGWQGGDTLKIEMNTNADYYQQFTYSNSDDSYVQHVGIEKGVAQEITLRSDITKINIRIFNTSGYLDNEVSRINISKKVTTTTTTTSNNSSTGKVGGGTSGGGTYPGTQSSAGNGGSFGQGANQTATNYRYVSGAGGGGWYGGGRYYSNSSDSTVGSSGGGSGFVNTAASAGNRPSGYTGLQLDSGETKDGATSFPDTAGTGNETGHSGNGYAKITRLRDEGYEAEIEYLRSTGTQYIDTGIKGASDIKIVIDGKYNSTSSNQGHGSYVSPIFYLGVYSSKFIFRSGSSSATSPVSANTNRHVFSMENGVGKIDNTSYTIGTYSGNEGDYLYLFARKTSSGVGLQASFWLYSCQIYKNNVLVRDFIPVRIGQTGYLYDKVSGNLFGNIGTGSFTLGPDV